MLRRLATLVLVGLISLPTNGAAQGTVPIPKTPSEAALAALRSIISAGKKSCADRAVRFAFCGWSLDAEEARKSGQLFWDQEDSLGFTVAKMVNLQGLGDLKGQSTFIEFVSDLWGSTRIGIGGVFRASDTTTIKSKAQQLLNGGGPAVITLLRPLAVANIGGSRSILLVRAQGSFSVPGQGSAARDSLKFADVGADLRSTFSGTSNRIGGVVALHFGRIVAGNSFYKAYGKSNAFSIATGSLGIVVEEAAEINWTRIFSGPNALRDVRDLIGVKITR